ncbi:serine/threonine-protein kinase ATG1c-like isoform X2 [Asparagus officinalis]|uniref:serine/threonine-protein kinase ATG1c-like isoform X2 n=1 Tax=Asparagus officinalis TaxID=4686 RepID=UPI00098E3D93|nr:serine/threonine-protein kinase ATG1c-like isoform X2 [Asparagus officinalis]
MASARVVGDYMFGRQIGSGSFSVVWLLARHRILGFEVAVKEIVMEKLGRKLQESLLSEIVILKKIKHPNIIALHDIIEAPGRIYLVLEYCRGGDLSMYIQRHGSVPEATAKHFMQQLAAGLQVLRENNLIHRDLKPQNLLLSTYDENSVLKIADFGFARSLQPRGLAETLCGSPLYMAPEIMQLQKYDAKADLWSVGAILYQLVTGRTPFSGMNQIQLLQNIIKSNELRFPPDNNLSFDCIDLCQKLLRRNPVERLTFEEFFNHQFLSQQPPEESLSRTSSDMRDVFPSVESSPARPSVESSQEDCLPFILDDESIGQDGNQSVLKTRGSVRPTYGFSVDSKVDKSPVSSQSNNVGVASRFSSSLKKMENTNFGQDTHISQDRNVKETTASRKDSLEFVDQEYVLVPGPPLEMSSSSVSALPPRNSPGKLDGSPIVPRKMSSLSAPVPISGAAISDRLAIGSLDNRSSPASGTSQGSMDTGDTIEQPSAHCMTRIRSLQQSAFVITELMREEVANGRRLEAFSIQLVILAIWKQALHICHAHAASAIEGSPSHKAIPSSRGSYSSSDSPLPDALCSQIEKDFLVEVEHAEELARDMGQVEETMEMPDAIEIIFQSALTLGRHGAVDEMMGNTERAAARYSKAVCLLHFLLVEASSLVLNPPVSLTNSDRYRLRSYIDIISNRHSQSRSTLLKV